MAMKSSSLRESAGHSNLFRLRRESAADRGGRGVLFLVGVNDCQKSDNRALVLKVGIFPHAELPT